MPAYKFKTCIIDGQEQYAVSPVDCKDHPPETRSIQFPESLLSFVDIEMHTIAPLISSTPDDAGAQITGIHRRKFPVGILQLKEQKMLSSNPTDYRARIYMILRTSIFIFFIIV